MLPGDIVGEIAKHNAGAYWLMSLGCQMWLRAVRRALPKFQAVAKFSRKVEIKVPRYDPSRTVKVVYTVLPNGKKNGVHRKEIILKNEIAPRAFIESFYLGGERIRVIKRADIFIQYATQRFEFDGFSIVIKGSHNIKYTKDVDFNEFRVSRYKDGKYFSEKYVGGEYHLMMFGRNTAEKKIISKTSMIHGKLEFFGGKKWIRGSCAMWNWWPSWNARLVWMLRILSWDML